MIKLFEMFAGYGGASFALKKAGIPFECVGYSEIDKYAIQCYEQNHEGKNFGDCLKIDPNNIPDFDLLTGGFPCQSFSNAGKCLGELDARGTLFNEIIRIAEVKKPKYMLLENVKGLTSKRYKETFNKILEELDRIGYSVIWKVLNSKNHGIPQNRERIFFACFRKEEGFFNPFPEKEELKIFLKDIIEKEVSEKYYLSKIQIDRLIYRLNIKIEPFIPIKNATNKGYLEGYPGDGVNLEQPNSKTRRGRIQKDVIGCLQTNDQRGIITEDFRIRKLTPIEYFRLMGFLDDKINLEGLSDSQKYKLAGNGWDINLVSKIFKEMIK